MKLRSQLVDCARIASCNLWPAQLRTAASHAAAGASQAHASNAHGDWEPSAAAHETSTRQPCPPEHSGREHPPAHAPSIAAAVRRRLAALAAPRPAQPGLAAPSRPGRRHMPHAWQSYLAARGYPPHLVQSTGPLLESLPEEDHTPEPGSSGGADVLPGSAKLQRLVALLESPVAVPSHRQDARAAVQSGTPAAEPSGRAAEEGSGAGGLPEQVPEVQEAVGRVLAGGEAAGGGGPSAQEEAAARRAWLQDQEVDAEEDGDGDGDGMAGDALLWGGASPAAAAQPGGVPEEPTSSWEDGGELGTAVAEPKEAVPRAEQLLLQAGVVGVPNSGKSTLTNALVGQKVSAVSSKTNTTESARLGAFTVGARQVALYDTPGVVSTRYYRGNSHARRVRSAWGTATDCELLLFIVDAHRQVERPDARVLQLVQELADGPLPAWDPPPSALILNKVDRLSREQLPLVEQLGEQLRGMYPFTHTFAISARHGHGVPELREFLLQQAAPGSWAVPGDTCSDMDPSELATEVVREKVFRRLYKELPYELSLRDVSFKHLANGSLRIEKDILVPTDQVRRIVVGRGGAAVGEIGVSARKDLEAALSKTVHLMLNVKVAKKGRA